MNVQNLAAVGPRFTASLLYQQPHRIGFVHQPQFACLIGFACIPGIGEETAATQNAVYICDHRRHPAHIEVFAARAVTAFKQVVNVIAHRLRPEAVVGHINGKLFGVRIKLNPLNGLQPGALLGVKGEHGDAVAGGKDQHHRRAVEHITGGLLGATGLQEFRFAHGRSTLAAFQHREDGADHAVDINIG